jgi:hypothetical protein
MFKVWKKLRLTTVCFADVDELSISTSLSFFPFAIGVHNISMTGSSWASHSPDNLKA